MSNERMLTTALVAFAVGASIALVIAPCSGSDTRKKVRKFATDQKDSVGYFSWRPWVCFGG
ncbi:MAG: YtxH domain-containing protein [Flavobacteriales bacterium]|nr:YtxH domain-containing protein [Flavobacteriales bacterium]MBP6697799.1 YtxH domain-containing protein [Flavobacteriales bacterium]